MGNGPKTVPLQNGAISKVRVFPLISFWLLRVSQEFFSFSKLGQLRAVKLEREAVFVELLFDDSSF